MQHSQISYQAGISDLCLGSILTVALNGVLAFWSVIPQPNLLGRTQWKHLTISWLISLAGFLKAHLSFHRPQILLLIIQWQERSLCMNGEGNHVLACRHPAWSSPPPAYFCFGVCCHSVVTFLLLCCWSSPLLPLTSSHLSPCTSSWNEPQPQMPCLSPPPRHSPEPQPFLSVLSSHPSPGPSQEARAALSWARARSHLSATLGTPLGFSSCRLYQMPHWPGNMSRYCC